MILLKLIAMLLRAVLSLLQWVLIFILHFFHMGFPSYFRISFPFRNCFSSDGTCHMEYRNSRFHS